jgi:hypothetical protein
VEESVVEKRFHLEGGGPWELAYRSKQPRDLVFRAKLVLSRGKDATIYDATRGDPSAFAKAFKFFQWLATGLSGIK